VKTIINQYLISAIIDPFSPSKRWIRLQLAAYARERWRPEHSIRRVRSTDIYYGIIRHEIGPAEFPQMPRHNKIGSIAT
jgi:hypothetical protein